MAALAGACGGGGDDAAPARPGDASADGTIGAGDGGGGDGAGGGDGSTLPPPRGYAYLYLLARAPNGPANVRTTEVLLPFAPLPPECFETTFGSCTRRLCRATDAGVRDAGPPPTVGLVTWSGLATDPADRDAGPKIPFTLSGSDQAPYTLIGGEPVHLDVSADAGPDAATPDVPPFSDDLTVPLALLLTSPATDGGPITVHGNADLALAWQRGAPDVRFYFQASVRAFTGESGTLVCDFPSETGGGVVPAAAFASLDTVSFDLLYTFLRKDSRVNDIALSRGVTFLVADDQKRVVRFQFAP